MSLQELIDFINNSDDFPEITNEEAEEAYFTSLMKIKNEYDAFYYFASMNLLNAYVKKPYATEELRKKYGFKNYVVRGIEQVIEQKIKNVRISFKPEVTYVSVLDLQFSFHNLKSSYEIREFTKSRNNIEQQWCGIRLQPPAAVVYRKAKEIYEVHK